MKAPGLISIGKGKGLVLDGQSLTVHEEAAGLLLHAGGEPAEADAKRWKRVGELTVGPGGLVVLDSALSAKKKSRDRATVPLAAGVYDVLAHRSGGFGNDFSAVRLQRSGAVKKEKPAQARAGARRFEFKEAASAKFWEVSVRGATLMVRFGRLGTAGQQKDKTFPSAGAAQKEADKLIREKTAKGYVEK